MAQRCTYCGKTEKQHGGKPCMDPSLLHALRIPIELPKPKSRKES